MTTPLLEKLKVRHELGATWQPSPWINRDIVPLPPYRRKWGPWTFIGFWLVAGVNTGGWVMGSAMISLGLDVVQSMCLVLFSYITIAFLIMATGYPGAKYHICFAVIGRHTWGMRGSFFPLLNRIVLSITWHGVQAYFGGKMLRLLIGSITPSFYNLNARLAGGTMDVCTFIGIALFCLIEVPLIWFPPEVYHIPFLFSSGCVCLTIFSILLWGLITAHGAGAMLYNTAGVAGVEQSHGSRLAWALVYGYSSQLGSLCAGILNQSDYTRFARKSRDQILGQAFVIPISSVITGFVGIVVTSCAAKIYPNEKHLLWEPYNLLRVIQENSPPSARAAVFFASFCWTLQQLAINVGINACAGGIDLSGIFPSYVNIRRGAYFTLIVSILMQPWQLLNGSSVFISVMSGYAVFLAPFTGILVADFFIVRKKILKLVDLYDPLPSSIYYFYKGFNVRAIVAWIFGVWPTLPGFAAKVGQRSESVGIGWTHAYYLCYPLGFAISFCLFILLNFIWPPAGLGEEDDQEWV